MAEGSQANGASASGASGSAAASSGAGPKAGISLSFKGKKPARPVGAQESQAACKGEAITGIGAQGVVFEDDDGRPAVQAGHKVIPKQENTFQVGVGKKRPTFVPQQGDAAVAAQGGEFEAAAPEVAVPVQYGLQRRERPANGVQDNGKPSTSGREWEAQKYREDVAALPDAAGLDAYQSMPIENFGEAMLRGMGWREGLAVGRNAKPGEVAAVEYVKRPQGLGLGATPAALETRAPKKHIKPGDTRAPAADLVYKDAEGRIRHTKPAGEALVARGPGGPAPGRRMRVIAGRHSGFECEVLSLEAESEGHSARARVRLLPSDEEVSVRLKELGERGEAVREERKHKGKEEKRDKHRSRDRGEERRERSREAEPSGRHKERGDKRATENGHAPAPKAKSQRIEQAAPPAALTSSARPWLAPHICVRIVDKNLRGGKLYLKKATVVDVALPTVCDVRLQDGGQVVQQVPQSALETVVPKAEGALVLVLAGEQRGERARLLKRNSEAGAAAVQLLSDFTVHKVSFDDIAEYVGEAE